MTYILGPTAGSYTLLTSMCSGYNEQQSSFFNFISSIINFAYVGVQLECLCGCVCLSVVLFRFRQLSPNCCSDFGKQIIWRALFVGSLLVEAPPHARPSSAPRQCPPSIGSHFDGHVEVISDFH